MIHQKPPAGVPVYSVAFGGPFSGRYERFASEYGPTLGELIAVTPNLPEEFWRRGEVRICDHVIPRERWHVVRPKPGTTEAPVYVTLHLAPRGGGSSSGSGGSSAKNIIGIVAALALTVATAGIASGFVGTALGIAALGQGTFGALALAGAVGLAGSLAVSALTAAPTGASEATASDSQDRRGSASADGNVVDPGGALPRVVGTRRVFPPFVNSPYYEVIDGDEYVTGLCALAGPHMLDDLRIGDALASESDDVEVETREGWDDDSPITLVTRQCRITGSSVQMSEHALNPDTVNDLAHQSTPDVDLPKWHYITSRKNPDRVKIFIQCPAGIYDSDATDSYYMFPIRMQIRRRGDVSWKNLPEVWLSSRKQDRVSAEIVLDWGVEPAVAPVNVNRGFVQAWRSVPVQADVLPAGIGGWAADSYFGTSGSTYLDSSNEATTGVLHTHLSRDAATFWLSPTSFPKGMYEVRVKRGAAIARQNLSTSYRYGSGGGGGGGGGSGAPTPVIDFFGYVTSGVHKVPVDQDNRYATCYIVRCQSEWDQHPVQDTGDALIAVRARNRAIESISAVASGYVQDWDGSAWATWTTTGNPAPHYRAVQSGALNARPLPDALIDDAALLDWRARCAAQDYRCDAIFQGERVQDVLTTIAACAYARPYQSELWGVIMDRDSSAEPPVQVFSPRNMRGFRFERAFARLPDGFRVSYRSVDDDYAEQQMVVYRDGVTSGDDLEAVTYEGLVREADVAGRAAFDLKQAVLRSTFYYGEAPAEAIVCRRGDLVGVTHDVLSRQVGSARVKERVVSGGNITGLVLDSAVDVVAGETGIVIRRADGSYATAGISGPSGARDEITLAVPIPDDLVWISTGHAPRREHAIQSGRKGALVVWGPLTQEYRRMLVFDVAPGADGVFSLTFVDEAPELWGVDTRYLLDGHAPVAAADVAGGIFTVGGVPVTDTGFFTRTGPAKVVQGASGVLETVAANALSYDYSSGRRRLIFEGQITNLCLRSQEFGMSPWVSSMTVTSNVIAAPDGTMTGDMLTLPGTVNPGHYQVATVTASTVYTFSVWARLGTMAAADFKLAFRDDTAGAFIVVDLVPSVLPTSSGWTRLTYTLTTPAGCTSLRCYPYHNSGSPSGTFYLWGAQLEASNKATSYIATAGTTVTRAADYGKLAPGVLAQISGTENTVLLRGRAWNDGGNAYIIGGQPGALIARGNNANVQMSAGATTSYVTIGTSALPGDIGVCIGWDAAGRIGAVNAGTPVINATPMSAISEIYIGPSYALQGQQRIEVDEFALWPTKGSAVAVQAQSRAWE